ncbi:MAG TPA: DUF1697 domain-containing protein [Microscillaceae bacterium]|jgi:uncharacterized protein (DUF1697 family)|nr:DUF1697 domain-containing protein [Microscillaceae bacterium]
MTTYIALLRGINVGGHRKIPMATLRQLCEALGWQKVQTYIQSGNLVFQSDDVPESLAVALQQAILNHFGFEVVVIIRTAGELMQVLEAYPWRDEAPEAQQYFTLLANEPDPSLPPVVVDAPEKYHLDGLTVYLFCANGYGQTKMGNDFFERKLKQKATTRNRNTIVKLIEMAQNG